jgi:hypothetical protein
VSLLVDNRCDRLPIEREKIQALTVHGIFHAVENEGKRKRILEQFLVRHPDMKQFLSHPEAEVISVRAKSFLFLDGVTDSYHITL